VVCGLSSGRLFKEFPYQNCICIHILTSFPVQFISLQYLTVLTILDLNKSRYSSLHNIQNYSRTRFSLVKPNICQAALYCDTCKLSSVPKEGGQVSWSCKPTDLKLFVCISKPRYDYPWLVTSGTSSSKEMYGSRKFLTSVSLVSKSCHSHFTRD
jgi:hypothetical protein